MDRSCDLRLLSGRSVLLFSTLSLQAVWHIYSRRSRTASDGRVGESFGHRGRHTQSVPSHSDDSISVGAII